MRYLLIILAAFWLSACQSDSPNPNPDGTDPDTTATNPDDKPKPKPKTAVPDRDELMKSSSYYRQDGITPAKASQIAIEYVSEDNDRAEIELQLLKDNTFQLHLLVIQDDFPLILVGGYDKDGEDFVLQFTDSELARRIFGEEFNATTNIKMISASEVVFPASSVSIDIWGIKCNKK